jgi:hypothetical protein
VTEATCGWRGRSVWGRRRDEGRDGSGESGEEVGWHVLEEGECDIEVGGGGGGTESRPDRRAPGIGRREQRGGAHSGGK